MMVVHLCEKLGLLYCMSQLGMWVGGWVGGCQTPPPPPGGVGHLSVCGYAKILGGWVPEFPPPPPLGWLSKTLVRMSADYHCKWVMSVIQFMLQDAFVLLVPPEQEGCMPQRSLVPRLVKATHQWEQKERGV